MAQACFETDARAVTPVGMRTVTGVAVAVVLLLAGCTEVAPDPELSPSEAEPAAVTSSMTPKRAGP